MYLIFYLEYLQTIYYIVCIFPVVVLFFILYYLYYYYNNCLLILPISGLHGFISRHVGLFLKFSLGSLRVIKDSLSAVVLMRSAKSCFIAIYIYIYIGFHCDYCQLLLYQVFFVILVYRFLE